ncbi:MAG: pyridoxamine 5'-phosphate oxidase [Bacteroidota bacterium]|nr:pyridoxamine 5'-phosphate oxidase [bacterium]NBP63218.1 pyridoxamine 5'-phosphate oxidase [Bacteroidota bacterium]
MIPLDDISSLRKEYKRGDLIEQSIPEDPIALFAQWFSETGAMNISEPNAMILTTVSKEGKPSSRAVLLKGLEQGSFVFFTNYESRKAQDILLNPHVSLLFLWLDAERQIRIEGKATKISIQESEQYFATRPRESQLGAWASDQSKPISSREELEKKFKEMELRFQGIEHIPMPEHWGGFAVSPLSIEFWQGRIGRLHDRIQYQKQGDSWTKQRLNP